MKDTKFWRGVCLFFYSTANLQIKLTQMGHHKQTMKPGFSLEVDNQAPLFTNTHAGWVQRTWQQKPISKDHFICR